MPRKIPAFSRAKHAKGSTQRGIPHRLEPARTEEEGPDIYTAFLQAFILTSVRANRHPHEDTNEQASTQVNTHIHAIHAQIPKKKTSQTAAALPLALNFLNHTELTSTHHAHSTHFCHHQFHHGAHFNRLFLVLAQNGHELDRASRARSESLVFGVKHTLM